MDKRQSVDEGGEVMRDGGGGAAHGGGRWRQ